MGVERGLHIGPYVRCTYKDATRKENMRGCTNTSCKQHPTKSGPNATGKFCSACGGPNGDVAIELPARPDPWDVNGDRVIHLDFEGIDPDAEMAWFAQAFAKELDALRKVYETVEVRWGLHQYFH